MFVLVCVGLIGQPALARNSKLLADIDRALADAGAYLASKQSPDGAWRSETYGCFRDGVSLTPMVTKALHCCGTRRLSVVKSLRSGRQYLLSLVDATGSLQLEQGQVNFPVYASALASEVVAIDGDDAMGTRARDTWLGELMRRRFSADLSWNASDPQFGGWGYSIYPPQKPDPDGADPRWVGSNISATVYALDAFWAAHRRLDDATRNEILLFVTRCQNFDFARLPDIDDPASDGGFFFSPSDVGRNKAGEIDPESAADTGYRSYGSATADGLRALLLCGLSADHPRVAAGRKWLEWNFSAATHPGRFPDQHASIRQATYYYYCDSVARTFRQIGLTHAETKDGGVRWAEALAQALIKSRHEDGSWSNPFNDAKEDDPLVATPLAVRALTTCREVIRWGPNGPVELSAQQKPKGLSGGK